MSSQIEFLINGQPANPPQDYKALQLQYDWTDTRGSATLNTTEFTWIKSELQLIRDWIDKHGLTEAPPLEIFLNGQRFFNGYIDIASQETRFQCDKLTAPCVAGEDPSNLRDLAQSFTFAYLESKGYIKPSDYIPVRYQVNRKIETERVFMLTLALFLVSRELVHIVIELAKAISQLAGGITVIVSVLHLALMLAYTVILITYLITVIQQIIELFFQPVRVYNAMTIKRLFEVGCSYLGLKFESSIFNRDLESRMILLPAKNERGALVGKKSFDAGYPEKTFLTFINDCIIQFNGRIRVHQGTLYFERKDRAFYYSGISLKDIPNRDHYRTNSSEWTSNWLLKIPSDSSDLHTTLQPGKLYQVTVKPQNVVNPRNVTLRGLEEVNFSFALGTRKTQETAIEKIITSIQEKADKIIEPINKLSPRRRRQIQQRQGKGKFKEILSETSSDNLPVDPNKVRPEDVAAGFPNRVNKYLNHLSLDEDFFTVDKLLVINADVEGKLSVSNDLLSAKYFWDEYYAISSIANKQNQFKIYENVEVPLCPEDFTALTQSNLFFIESLNTQAELIRVDYNPYTQLAKLDFKIAADLAGPVIETKTDGITTTSTTPLILGEYKQLPDKYLWLPTNVDQFANVLPAQACPYVKSRPESEYNQTLYSSKENPGVNDIVSLFDFAGAVAPVAPGSYTAYKTKKIYLVSAQGIIQRVISC